MNTNGLGLLLLGVWLIASGVMPLAGISFAHAGTILEVLMIASGILIIIGTRKGGRLW